MTFAPGKYDHGGTRGKWERDLRMDLDRLRQEYGTDVLVTLLEDYELTKYRIPNLIEEAQDVGMEVLHFPIVDVSTPDKAQSEKYAVLIKRILDLLREGKTVVAHCRGGIGRTGVVAASVLTAIGYTGDEAIGLVRKARSPRMVETKAQEEYVRSFAREWKSENETRRNVWQSPEPTQAERYRGCLLGLAAGDALGATVEFKPRGSFEPMTDIVGGGPHSLNAGEWTDDTSMALCLAASLVEKRGFDLADQLRKYVRWYREGYMSANGVCFDIGNATRQALERFEKTGEPYSGSTNPKSAGNGSIMRLAPVALFYARGPLYPFGERGSGQPFEAVEKCGESSRTTHGAATTIDICRYFGGLIIGAVNGVGKEELLSERYNPDGGEWEPLTNEMDEIASGSFKHKCPPEIKGSGYVVRSLEAALWAFHNSDSFEEGALLAVNLGDDADTTGAVYGQLAGAYYGESGIPETWRRKLAHRLLIEYLAEQLLKLGKTVEWDRLLAYLPTFDNPRFSVKELPSGQSRPYASYQHSPEIDSFKRDLLAIGVVFSFDWMEWRKAHELLDDPEALARADELDLRKLLIVQQRQNHWDNDYFYYIASSGALANILRRLKEITDSH